MDSPSTPSRSRYSDLPKLDSAEGAIDWARKVRALQQQVDADEEAEYKRLQEEIAASRIARKRRSRGGFVSPTSAEFASSRESLSEVSQKSSTSDLKSIADRQQSQVEAFHKLNGTSSSSSPSNSDIKGSIATARAWMTSNSSNATASKPSGPISLAAFMGGRASGPILNKHAPQQDAHDPTQFEDRGRITAPHPVFGRGGVAMPGLTASSRFPLRDEIGSLPSVVSPKYGSDRAPTASLAPLERTVTPANNGIPESSPSTTAPLVIRPRSASPTKIFDERPVPLQKTGGRDRTISIPSVSSYLSESGVLSRSSLSEKNGPRERTLSSSPSESPPVSAKFPVVKTSQERPVSTTNTGSRDRTISTPTGNSRVTFTVSDSTTSDNLPSLRRPISTSFTPPKPPIQATSLSKSPPHKSPVSIPSLAKPIRPDPKPSPQTSHMPVSPNTSPAFLKPPVQKEPTPSISRLQGRGFVQNMVKASHTFETPSSSTQTTPDRPVSASRKATVLERWHHNGSPSPVPASSPPVTSPKPLAMRKSFTLEPNSSLKATATGPSVTPKPVKTFPLTTKVDSEPIRPRRDSPPMLNSQGTGLGSATTLVVFKPPADEEEVGSFGVVNELGVKHSAAQQKLPVVAGKPLTHPTKERARKPKKSQRQSTTPVSSNTGPPISVTQQTVKPADSPVVPFESESPTRFEPLRPTPVSRTSGGPGKLGRVADRWAEQAIIGISGMVGRRALPGLAATPTILPKSSEKSPVSPSLASKYPSEPTRPTTPSRHSRIPSTGNRATVMDVAQAFTEPQKQTEPEKASPEVIEAPASLPPLNPNFRQNINPPALSERRRSSYQEKYSAIVLPPLREEVTPTPTPVSTVARGSSPAVEHTIPTSIDQVLQGTLNQIERTAATNSDVVHINHDDPPLPSIDIDVLLKSHQLCESNSDLATVSVEVMIISGNNAAVLSRETDIFYDAEVLAIVHRSKSKSSGLVSTTIWGWLGKNCEAGDLEQNKLEELSKRYGTNVILVKQYAEPSEMLRVLGNHLAVRQGKRAHWSADNTAMHVTRSRRGVIFIDELDLTIRNLCSGFSYCLTVLETIYVWYGRGSVASERKAALAYGRSLGENIVELQEGQDDGDEMFWMILGEKAFANANYWQWRPSAADINPRVLEVSEQTVKPVDFLQNVSTMVHLVDCVWEYFIIVGSEARTQRQNIRIALYVASELVRRVGWQRPYIPPIHVVILPSQIPLDLKIHLREIDESSLNPQGVPEHMNLLTFEEAHDHLLRRTFWE
ncbi:gelsolin repeat [Lentinula edodes]|uniref:Gelsolin repeat n=1 Tax=Lentinula edodes TaxID=5353 RepID=A0A1Q3EE87_LENED|nr:gelsolin repeat [Lentinula edodes]